MGGSNSVVKVAIHENGKGSGASILEEGNRVVCLYVPWVTVVAKQKAGFQKGQEGMISDRKEN